ncbi:MAG TPA: DUF6325 family protein [Candidatus Limnocylindria bacterium]|jgi:hypothetical protein
MMGIGPVQYMVVAFPGNQFKGEIAPALQDLVQSGTIRIIDLAFVIKDADGSMTGVELEDAGSDVFQAFESLTAERGGFVSEQDLHEVAGALDPNSSAAILVWEDVWATRLTEALANAGGQLVDIQRVPRELVEEAVAWAEENKAGASA